MFALYYPDEPGVNAGPTFSYVPSKCPLMGFEDGLDLGLLQQRTADGELQSYIIHDTLRRRVRPFAGLTSTDKTARDAFFSAVRGLAFRYTDDILYPTFVTVRAVGASLAGEWTVTARGNDGLGIWSITEEFEESAAVPSLGDYGDYRHGYVDFTNSENRKFVTFSPAPFADANYRPDCQPMQSSNGELIEAWPEYGSLVASGYYILLGAAPGTSNTVRVYYEAIHF